MGFSLIFFTIFVSLQFGNEWQEIIFQKYYGPKVLKSVSKNQCQNITVLQIHFAYIIRRNQTWSLTNSGIAFYRIIAKLKSFINIWCYT